MDPTFLLEFDGTLKLAADFLTSFENKADEEKAEKPRGSLPALKVPDPGFIIERLNADKPAGLLSRRRRTERVGEHQALVNEIAPLEFDKAYVWAVVSQSAPEEIRSMADLSNEKLAGLDQFTKEEFSTEKGIYYLPLKLVTAFEPQLELRAPIPGRRFAGDVDFDRDVVGEAEAIPTKSIEDDEVVKDTFLHEMIKDPDLEDIAELSDGALQDLDKLMHSFFERLFGKNDLTMAEGVTREAVVNLHYFLLEELRRRDIETKEKDRLGEETSALTRIQSPVSKGVRAPFGSFGGSSRYAKKLIPHFPEHKVYVEPFAGSAAVLYAKEPSDKEIIADLDGEIVFLHSFIKEMNDSFLAELNTFDWIISEEAFNRAKALTPKSDLERFYRSYYLKKTSFFKQGESAGFGRKDRVGHGIPIKPLIKAGTRLRGVIIEELDYREVIAKYDGPETFFYIDPPWPGEWFDKSVVIDLDEFISVLKGIKGRFIAEINKSKVNEELYGQLGRTFSLRVAETNPMAGGETKVAYRLFAANFPAKEKESKSVGRYAPINPSGRAGHKNGEGADGGGFCESVTEAAVRNRPQSLCIYHRDIDGMCAAAIVFRVANRECELLDINYGEDFPWDSLRQRETIYMVDFALQPFNKMVTLKAYCEDHGTEFIWVDHHVEALKAAKKIGFDCAGLRVDGEAACELTWRYFHPGADLPYVVHCAGRFDVWDHREEAVLPLHYAMEAMDLKPSSDIWDSLFINGVGDFSGEVVIGKKIMSWIDKFNAESMKELSFPLDFEGLNCIAGNSSMKGSETFKSVSDGYQAIVKFTWVFPGIWSVSLYGLGPDVDVGSICSKYGGGGHKGAGGFQCKDLPFDLPKEIVHREKRRFAPINPSGRAGHKNDPVELAEIVDAYDKPMGIRSPAVYLVGSACNVGKTENDIDLLIRGPLDEETLHVIKFRLGRALDPKLSERIQFHHDEQGGPFTNHVPLYDLVLVPHEDRSLKEMSLEKQDDPLLDWPKKPGKRSAVFSYHFRGKSLHGDVRMKVDDHLVGWTLALQKRGAVPTVETLSDGRSIAKEFDVEGSRYNKPMVLPDRVFAAPKARQPVPWLNLGDVVFAPGSVGATRFEEGVIIEVAEPKAEWGMQKAQSHEYFLTGDPKFSGTLIFRLLAGGKAEEDGTKTPEGEFFWTCGFAKNLLPSVLRRRSVRTKTMPPLGHSAMPMSLMQATPREFRFWEADSAAEARKVRDELVDARVFTEETVKMVGQEYRLVKQKVFHVAHDPEDVDVEKVRTTDFTLSWQYFKGQTVIRAAPSRQLWHLIIAKPIAGVWDYQLQRDPLSGEAAVTALFVEGGKDLLGFEGEAPPGTTVGGVNLNHTKATSSEVKIQDRGKAELLDDQPTFKKIRFKGKDLKGIYTLVAEEAGSKIWQFSPGADPGRAIPTKTGTDVVKRFRLRRDGTQIWSLVDRDEDDDKGRDRDALRPPAIFQPMKPAPRKDLRFTDPDEATKEIFTDVLIKQGVQIEPKLNGFRAIVERWDGAISPEVKAGGVLIYTEDRKRDISENIPGLTEEIDSLGGNFVLDGEIMAVDESDNFVPRRELAAFRGDKPVPDENIRLLVFDALYLPKIQNITSKTLVERRRHLERWWKASGRKAKRLVLVPRKMASTREGIRNGIDWASKQPGSEGAMMKHSEATYSLGGENDLYGKVKTTRGLKVLVVDRHSVKGSPGVYNFVGAVGPIPKGEEESWPESVNYKGRRWAIIGVTGNRKLDAKVGDVISAEFFELLWEEGPPNRIRWFGPAVALDIVGGNPASLGLVKNALRPGEVKERKDRKKRILTDERRIRLMKREGSSDEERYVFGVVLVPEEADAQGEIYSQEEVRKAAFSWMEFHGPGQNFKVMHDGEIIEGITVLETYVSKTEEIHGEESFPVGTWFLGARVNEDEIWHKIKSGEYTGWSMGGTALREKLSPAT